MTIRHFLVDNTEIILYDVAIEINDQQSILKKCWGDRYGMTYFLCAFARCLFVLHSIE